MKLTTFKSLSYSVFISGIALFFSFQAKAQGVSVTNFEDASKSSYAAETKIVNGYSWYFSSVNIGNDADRDMKFDGKAARFRQVDTMPVELRLESSLEDISAVSFYYARSDFSGDRTGTSPTIVVAVGSDDVWTHLDTINLAGVDELTLYSRSDIEPGYDHFKIFSISGANGKRFNVDSISITYDGEATAALALTYKEPFGSGVPVTTESLKATYNTNIEKGSGEIYLFKDGGDLLYTIDVSSADVSISDSIATISGIELEGATTYYVKMDAGVFAKAGSPTIISSEITSTSEWRFTTVDTTTYPDMTSLNETFTSCSNSGLMGVFKQYSVSGAKKWTCSSFGRTDSHSVYINGGTATGVSEENEDWLISMSKFDFAAMDNPSLSFWTKRRFDGDVMITVKMSTDYAGDGNPEDATWTDLYTVPSVDLDWKEVKGISLNTHKSTPFYLAFHYSCGTEGAFEFTLDDIKVSSSSTSIGKDEILERSLLVLGEATGQSIRLRLNAATAGNYELNIIDINGRKVHQQNKSMNEGVNDFEVSDISLQSGLYLIKIQNAENGQIATVKAVVK